MAFNLFLWGQRDLAVIHQQQASRWFDNSDHVFFRSQLQAMTNQDAYADKSQRWHSQTNWKFNAPGNKANPARKLIGQPGALHMLTQIPIEVLYEIFGYLHPMDVLSLSRTTRGLRNVLLAPHARGVWRSALAGVRALPPCPADMTEPQYASLAFDEWCQSCLSPKSEKTSWLCRVRYCRSCIKKHFVPEAELVHWIPEEAYFERLDSIFPLIFLENARSRETEDKPLYHVPSARQYVKELKKITLTLEEKDALDRWILEKKELQLARLTHAGLCEFWDVHFAYRRPLHPSPSHFSEVVWIIVLVIILAYLWRK